MANKNEGLVMVILAKPCNKTFVVSSEHKEEFIRKAKDAKSFDNLMARSTHIPAQVSFHMLTGNSYIA